MDTGADMKALYIVANAGHTDKIMDILRQNGATGGTIIHARGEGSHHRLFLGITLDHEQEIVICIAEQAAAEQIMDAIQEKAGWKSEVHGICYMLPIEKIIGLHQPE